MQFRDESLSHCMLSISVLKVLFLPCHAKQIDHVHEIYEL